MLIVSQDKKRTSENLEIGIYPEYNDELPEQKILCYKIENDYMILGEYQTEERAKEVLQEIVDTYLRKIFINNSNNQRPILDNLVYQVPINSNIQYINTDIVYEMPEE